MNVSLRCASCGGPNPAGARFCGNCGLLLRADELIAEMDEPETLSCSRCGAEAPLNAAFCGTCGASRNPLQGPSPVTGVAADPFIGGELVGTQVTASATAAPSASEPAGEGLVRCRQCGYENPPHARFCGRCGSEHFAVSRLQPSGAYTAEQEDPAGLSRRLLAFAIDVLVVGFVWLVIRGEYDEGLAKVPWLVYFIIYNVLGTGLLGQTAGKMWMRIRVVNQRQAWAVVPGLRRAALRELLGKPISVIALGLGCLWVAWDPRSRAWHDMIAGTYVIKV